MAHLQLLYNKESQEFVDPCEPGCADAGLDLGHNRAGEDLCVALAVIPGSQLIHIHCHPVGEFVYILLLLLLTITLLQLISHMQLTSTGKFCVSSSVCE